MSAPLLVLDLASSLPPYEQIGTQLRLHIASGHLLPGALLPSVRQLAHDLGVAPNTVARAYSELEREGWVITAARRGVLVAPSSLALVAEVRTRELQRLVSQVLMTAYQLGIAPTDVHAELHRQLGISEPA